MLKEHEMIDKILSVAKSCDNVRLVLMNGSRVNPREKVDLCSDFDVVYFVDDFDKALKTKYDEYFEGKMLLHTSDDMIYLKDDRKDVFIFQMLFKDKNRIDLSLRPIHQLKSYIEEEPIYEVLLDKDNHSIPKKQVDDHPFIIKKPSFELFESCVKTFLWLEPYVAKGLYRNEPIYALKHITLLRDAFETMLKWKTGVKTDFDKVMGKAMKHLRYYLGEDVYKMYLKTYSSGDIKTLWNTLFYLHDKFLKVSKCVADDLNYTIDFSSFDEVKRYLRDIKGLSMSNVAYDDYEMF